MQLNQELTNHLAINSSAPKIAILGIGNELNGDDGAGLLVARKLSSAVKSTKILIVEGSIAPENMIAPIRRFGPDWIWLMDAAEFSQQAGSVQLLPLDQILGTDAFTHSTPAPLLIKFLQEETGARIFLFGIQFLAMEPFTEVTRSVQTAVARMAANLIVWLKNNIMG
jgi:hydrogenase 3 maturation protease